ncbi:MAG: O-antigen ligase family protein, partial [Planctomycetaceae bacterium]
QPTNLCVMGMIAGVALSHLSSMYLFGLRTGVMGMLKVALYYLLLVSLVNTPQRLRRFLICTALSASVMIAYSVRDYVDFVSVWDGNPTLAEALLHDAHLKEGEERILRHVVEQHTSAVSDAGDVASVYRMRGLGIFNDPNDVALLIVVTSIIGLYFLTDRKLGQVRFVWGAPLLLMAAALYCTQSRGGILAAGVAGTAWLAARYGGQVAVGLGVLGALCIPVALGRAGEIEITSGTGQSRIQLWGEGLAQLVSPKVLYGIGEGMYPEYAGLVAHNSFVHAFVELGFVGGTMFFGCVFFPAYALWRMHRDRLQILDPEIRRLRPYIGAMLACWCMGMCALSRCYVESTYMVIGAAAAYVNLAGFHQWQPRPIVLFNQVNVQRWVLCSFGLFCGCFVFVRLFAQWSG